MRRNSAPLRWQPGAGQRLTDGLDCDDRQDQCSPVAGTLGVKFELRAYEIDPNDLAAETVAQKVGMPPEQVFIRKDSR